MKLKTVLAAALLALGLSVNAQTIIKFSHVVAADTPKGKASEFFAKKAAELTKGKVKVEVYANSALYKDKEEMEALQMGSVQMLAPSLAKFGPLGVKEFEAFDLPFIFDDRAELHKITQGPVGASLMAKLQSRGITGLAFWDNGFKSFSANAPLKTVADYKGKKYRIQSSKVLEEQIRAVGGIPQVIAFGETYQALQTGVVDGTENPISNFFTQKMHEVQKHLTLTNHGYLGYAVIVNKKFWDNGFKSFSANAPLKTVADFKGKKYRIQSSKVLEEQIRAVGGIPQVIAFGETYQALQTGVVDGTENPISNFYTQKMHEVQKHLSLTNHGYLGYAVIVNKKFWDGLPADVRAPLEQALKEATDYANKIAQEENDKALEGVKASGKTTIYTPTKEERLALKKAMAPVHIKMTDRIGKEMLQEIYKATGFDPNAQ